MQSATMPDTQAAAGRGEGITRLQRSCGIPLYYQIFAFLRDNIIAGIIPTDTILPTEEELSDRFDVGRVTARRAVQELVGIGLVERRPRVGTRVIYNPVATQGQEGKDASNMLVTLDGETVRMIDYAIVEAAPNIASIMQLEPGQKIVRARRMRVFEGEPVALIDSILPERFAVHVPRDKLLRSHLHDLLSKAGLSCLRFEQSISSVAATPDLASMLKVDPRSPILCVERLIRSKDEGPVALTTTQFRADRVRLEFDSDGDFGRIAPKLVR
jgi:GntR family transcriptional regulator